MPNISGLNQNNMKESITVIKSDNNTQYEPNSMDYAKGIKSDCGKYIYFLGVIDILTYYS